MNRRDFLNSSLGATLSYFWLKTPVGVSAAESESLSYQLTRDVPTRLFDGKKCWCHPRAGIVPGAGDDKLPRVVMTMNTLDLAGSDVFKSMYGLETNNLGQTWSEPVPLDGLSVREQTIDGVKRPVAASDFWPTWHAASGRLLGTGHTVVYTPDWRVTHPRPRHTAYCVYDAEEGTWRPWQTLEMPPGETFADAGAGCTQRVDLAEGTILLPIYFRPPGKNSRVTIARCQFNGQTLRYEEHGQVLNVDDQTRGLGEPSLTRFDDTYFLTLRNDLRGYVTRSDDGQTFRPIAPWRFDDGQELGNYNTQQHWVTHSDGLFLVYTRRGANNDHVFRHRAPLFMAQVDPDRLCVIRDTEQVLVPERGARLGNFGIAQVSPDETWVTVSEWMQPRGVEKHGSDGSVFVARLHWNQPNKLFAASAGTLP